jgi:3-methyladenine DNA glycosylase AlkD
MSQPANQPHSLVNPSTISVNQLAQDALQQLQAAADERVARQARVFFKAQEDVHFFGVSAPKLRLIERGLYQQIKGSWTLADACAFADLLIHDPRQEAKTAGILLLARYHKSYVPELLDQFEQWLAQDHCSNWALTDALSTCVLALLLRRYPVLLPRLEQWTQAENLWLRRAAAVALVPLARKGEQLEAAYAIAERLLPYPEDLIHKAVGWLLREAGKPDSARLQAFLLQHGAQLPRTTLRYAIERFPADERNRLLAQTR